MKNYIFLLALVVSGNICLSVIAGDVPPHRFYRLSDICSDQDFKQLYITDYDILHETDRKTISSIEYGYLCNIHPDNSLALLHSYSKFINSTDKKQKYSEKDKNYLLVPGLFQTRAPPATS